MSDTLRTLLKVRRLDVDAARRGLAECLAIEDEARGASMAAEQAIAQEALAATALAADDAAVEAFAAWLPVGRRQLDRTRHAETLAANATERARAVTSLARAAAEAAQALLERREAEAEREAQRKAQLELDEMGRRRAV